MASRRRLLASLRGPESLLLPTCLRATAGRGTIAHPGNDRAKCDGAVAVRFRPEGGGGSRVTAAASGVAHRRRPWVPSSSTTPGPGYIAKLLCVSYGPAHLAQLLARVTRAGPGGRKPEPTIARSTRCGTSPGSPGRTSTATGTASMPYRKKLATGIMGSMIPWPRVTNVLAGGIDLLRAPGPTMATIGIVAAALPGHLLPIGALGPALAGAATASSRPPCRTASRWCGRPGWNSPRSAPPSTRPGRWSGSRPSWGASGAGRRSGTRSSWGSP